MIAALLSWLFPKNKIPDKIPPAMQLVVEELKKSKSKEECLKKAFAVITSKYGGHKLKTYILIWRIFTADLEKIWRWNGFLHCIHFIYLMRVLLIKSGHFKDKDIKRKWTLVCYFSPHSYLDINLGNRTIHADPWGRAYGIKLGDYTHGFHLHS